MDFFSKLGDSIQNVGKEVSKKSKDLGETMNLNNQIKENEIALNNTYQLLGKMYFETYLEEARSRYKREVGDIEFFLERINSYKAQIRELKGLKLCHECGAEIEVRFPRCPLCGVEVEVPKQEIIIQEEGVIDNDNIIEHMTGPFCTGCGAKITEGAKFCVKCGKKL